MEIKTDFLIIGSGIAGLSYALKVSETGKVAIITKKKDTESNTNYAQGGIAAVLSPSDSFDLHIQDTLKAGAGLSNEVVVRKVVESGPAAIQELIQIGVDFTRAKKELDLGREGGHSRNRVAHAADLTGREIESSLIRAIKSKKNIAIYEDHIAVDLITQHHLKGYQKKPEEKIKCWGAYVLDVRTGKVNKFLSKITLLATGGTGRIYLHTTNPAIATGDGIAMAYRAGAPVANLEFIQFHPTSLYHPEGNSFLISEAVRGEGGKLRLKSGELFMQNYHPSKELAPRDVVARAIDFELKKSGDNCIYLDITHLDKNFIKERFPNIYQRCLSLDFDITKEWIPVVPAAHYICGGIITDLEGKTDIDNLYACGEVAMTGMHGANRLASNSLLEAVVFANFAAETSRKFSKIEKGHKFPSIPEWSTKGVFDHKEWVIISHARQEIESLMWNLVGIVRSNSRLEMAKSRIDILLEDINNFYHQNPVTYEVIELRNITKVAELIIRSALLRKESRGLHFNQDYPQKDDRNWKKDTILKSR
ncbi:MAG: L-aspartate oxidase [candidate division Zixibacteria bacterium]|nr:L-aspartate oxidase [candidate division Zixibacteria bacterium]